MSAAWRRWFILLLILVGFGMVCSSGLAAGKEEPQPTLEAEGQFYLSRETKASPQILGALQKLRGEAKAQKWTFEVGYTEAMDLPLGQLSGLKPPPNLDQLIKAQNAIATKMEALEAQEWQKAIKKNPELKSLLATSCSAPLKDWDWRKQKKVTPIRNQRNCGSCWDFATIGAFEGSWAIRNNALIDASEQDVLDCSGAGSCAGGWWAFRYLILKGVAREKDYPYTAVQGKCRNVSRPYQATNWGYVGPSSAVPSVTALKQALCKYGPLTVAVRVTPAFQAYTGGVFNQNASGSVNHGVVLIGWDNAKQAWLIKNSWGPTWGSTCGYGTEKGYMWIKYGCCSIGYAAAWVQAKSTHVTFTIPAWALDEKVPVKP
jgi:cathepsin L